MSSKPSSLLGALQDAAAQQGEFFASAQEVDALVDDKGRIPADALRRIRMGKEAAGRPKGSRNKRNAKVAQWFVQEYGDPLAALGEIITMPVDVLYQQMVLAQGGEAKNKRITGRDAFEMKIAAAKDALPYIHGKQPISVEVTNKADAVIIMPGVNAPGHFSKSQLENAVESVGISALETAGVRMTDGRLIEDGEFFDVAQAGDEP